MGDSGGHISGTSFDGVRFEVVDRTALITLDRPEMGNSLTPTMGEAFRAIWTDVARDPKIRAVVVTGRGDRHFCTGIDVREVARTGQTVAGDGPVIEAIPWSPHNFGVLKPVICALNGLVAGGGLHFVADADIVLAADHVEFMDTHTSVGMVGAVENVGLTHRLPLGTVLRMTLWGRSYRLDAQRAYGLGLVDELCGAGQLLDRALALASEVSRNSPSAIAGSKLAIWSSLGRPRNDAEEYAWSLARAQRMHPDFIEGPRAFDERRNPIWSDD